MTHLLRVIVVPCEQTDTNDSMAKAERERKSFSYKNGALGVPTAAAAARASGQVSVGWAQKGHVPKHMLHIVFARESLSTRANELVFWFVLWQFPWSKLASPRMKEVWMEACHFLSFVIEIRIDTCVYAWIYVVTIAYDGDFSL